MREREEEEENSCEDTKWDRREIKEGKKSLKQAEPRLKLDSFQKLLITKTPISTPLGIFVLVVCAQEHRGLHLYSNQTPPVIY